MQFMVPAVGPAEPAPCGLASSTVVGMPTWNDFRAAAKDPVFLVLCAASAICFILYWLKG